MGRLLSHSEAKRYYDLLGAGLETQAFYERAALRDLAQHLDLRNGHALGEFGCGTGSFAATLLHTALPPDARYLGLDVSSTMVALAKRKLDGFGARASVVQSDGAPHFGVADGTFDRIVSSYVLDLLPDGDIRAFLGEAHRTLKGGGLLGLVSLTRGRNPISGVVSALWSGLHALSPWLVGGCRPLALAPYLSSSSWRIAHHAIVAPFGIASEIVVAARLP